MERSVGQQKEKHELPSLPIVQSGLYFQSQKNYGEGNGKKVGVEHESGGGSVWKKREELPGLSPSKERALKKHKDAYTKVTQGSI